MVSEIAQIDVEQPLPGASIGPRQKDGLDISPADDGYIVYESETDRVHFLNPTAVLILELCDGMTSEAAIATLVREAYGLLVAPVNEVLSAIATMRSEGLLA